MEKNKTGKYFKYAIGEIILVVIGILIALSINNWNEDRKNQELVSVYKTELMNDLLLDVNHFEFHKSHAEKENKTIDSLRTILKRPNSNEDTLNNIIRQSLTFFKREPWIMLATTEYPLVSDNTFKSLQSSGQITLLDNKLQEELVSFYGYTRKYTFMIQEIITNKNEVYFEYINNIPAMQSKEMNIVNINLYNQIWNNVDWNYVQIKFISLLNTYYELNLKTEFFNDMRLYKTNIMIDQLKQDLKE
jgi:hypothetical protein